MINKIQKGKNENFNNIEHFGMSNASVTAISIGSAILIIGILAYFVSAWGRKK
jgi:hypothetical protein